MGCKRSRRHPAIHEAYRRGCLSDAGRGGSAGITGTNSPLHPQDGRNNIERFAGRFSDAVQLSRAAGAGLAFRFDDDVIAWQMLGKSANIAA